MSKSKKTRPPLENDWLYACPAGMTTPDIVDALGAGGFWLAEVDASAWRDADDAFWSVLVALGHEDARRLRPQDWPSGGPFGYFGPVAAPIDVARRPNYQDPRELILIRKAGAVDPRLIGDLIYHLMGTRITRPPKPHERHDGDWFLVLEGWQAVSVDSRARRHRQVAVNRLPEPT